MTRQIVVTTLLTMSLVASAGEPAPKLKGTRKESAPKLDLGLPAFNAIPKDQKLETAQPKQDEPVGASGKRADEGYTLVRVVHGKNFTRSADGAKPTAPFPAVTWDPQTLTLEKFSSIIRVKSPGKRTTRIEVVILDTRTDTVMDASGELRFGNSDEAEWQVDWDPSSARGPGEFQVLVRVGGNPLGTTPLKVVSAAAK